jgi:hypothetical protein
MAGHAITHSTEGNIDFDVVNLQRNKQYDAKEVAGHHT